MELPPESRGGFKIYKGPFWFLNFSILYRPYIWHWQFFKFKAKRRGGVDMRYFILIILI